MRRHIDRIKGADYERGYVYNTHYHLIWVTKYRHQLFTTPQLVNEMKSIIRWIGHHRHIKIEEMEVMPDYIHLMISFKPKYAISTIVKELKGVSAIIFLKRHPRIRQDKFWGGHLWPRSYYIGTVGNMSKEIVRKYIQNQYKK